MATDADGRMRLTVLGGFLGSGKTTWLRHQLHAGSYADAFVIVNEAAETPVDHILLGAASHRRAVLAGGCACCEGRGALIALLRKLCDERSRMASSESRIGRIVLETSGLAEPGAIVDAIKADPVLVNHIVVGEVVVIVDALHALDQLQTEALGRQQVEIADRLVIAKLDAADEGRIARVASTLRAVNPTAPVRGAVKGVECPLPPLGAAEPEPLPALDGGARRAPIVPTTLHLDETVDWTAFGVWLSALLHARGDDVMRVKGVVRTPAGRLLLQSVRRSVQSPEILPDGADGPGGEDDAVVVIGRGYEPEQLRRSLLFFAGAGGMASAV